MSEYIEVETLFTDDPDVIAVSSNVTLAEHGDEIYESVQKMEEGSAVAQALALVEGINSVKIFENSLEITREPAFDWHVIVAEVNSALKDFFL